MAWDHRQYGTAADPIRQSDLNELATSYSCPERFRRRKMADAAVDPDAPPARIYGAPLIGDVVHKVIDRVLSSEKCVEQVNGGRQLVHMPPRRLLERAVVDQLEQLRKERGGGDIIWVKTTQLSEETDAVTMIEGALKRVAQDASHILFSEASFVVQIDGFWLVGTADLVYRDRSGALVLADWKTGVRVASQIDLDHGYQLGIYAQALADGWFFPGLSREYVEQVLAAGDIAVLMDEQGARVGSFPDRLHLVYLRDCLPYKRASKKTVTRLEEAEMLGVNVGAQVARVVGDPKGPAWYRGRRTAEDVARLKVSLKTIVGSVRLGRFIENIGGDTCGKCAFARACLNQGYGVQGDDRKELEKRLRGVEDLGDFAADLDAAQ